MRDFNYELKQLCQRNRDGSYSTQTARERILTQIANQLQQMGFRHMHTESLKPKHVEALVTRWKAEGLSAGTIKNRMTGLRWWAEKIGKQNVVERDNDRYAITDRQYVTNQDKGRELTAGDLSQITDPYTRFSLKLQAAFGLRREESISWTKGGRERQVPIRTPAQRDLLEEVKQLVGQWSLIPRTKTYDGQLQRFKAQCMKAGIHKVHGLRHHYAQERYRELTGWACPAKRGPAAKTLDPEQRSIDREARAIISAELGHSREQITAVYIGR
jgi:site-specific recombinase XerC